MNYKEFFTTDNKSGWKTREDKLSNKHPEIYNEIIHYSNYHDELRDLGFKQKVWHFINDIKEVPRCSCGNNVSFQDTINKGYNKYCSNKCSNNNDEVKNKIKKTNLEKYGVESASQSKEAINKRKKTNLEKYGSEYHISSKIVRTTIENNNIKKYGSKSTINLKNTKDKIKKTNLEKYGVENVFASNIIINKIKKTNLEKYGVEYYLKTKECKDRIKKTNLEKYGVENISKLDRIKDVISKKMLGREIKAEWIKKSIETKYKIKYIDYEKFKTDFFKYKRKVTRITNKQQLNILDNYNKRGKAGIIGAYHLDHKYSIFEGFKNDISPEIIGNIKNLEFIPWEENNKKKTNCSITIDKLKEIIYE